MEVNFRARVTDVYGQPLVGANIVSTGLPLRGVITDIDGYFQFFETSGAQFKISYVGFKPVTFVVTPQDSLTTFILREDVTELNEVVLTPRSGTPSPRRTEPFNVTSGLDNVVPNYSSQFQNTIGNLPAATPKLSFWDQIKDSPLALGGIILAGLFVGGAVMGRAAKASDQASAKTPAKRARASRNTAGAARQLKQQ
ncbi:carboxypeptidase-like regulatory domain-containing protein [Robiginitalea biformata]|uniref:Putative outer membrane protein n=1 Tax=Robiginitalea biformata (strain ATCC BAA-864 / DSM 15991 / KCTC 12146 / HTCC2501) TaxID=313596 RepID=A4CKP0_ROBBH|nr:carboxypeptidase-like regulatory domain-containing protein [Robiginitalea biformata]EAR15439.1 putative outer membrane protein [Robiginitalea biformata HTCC2501]